MLQPQRGRLRLASWLSVGASLLWIPQAACVAQLIAALVEGSPALLGPWSASLLFAALGLVKAGLAHVSGRIAFTASQAAISREREKILAAQSRQSPLATSQRSSAEITALAADKLELVAPYILRYAPAMARTRTVPFVILAIAMVFSWTVAFILLIAGPLIPIFMILVGMAARTASEKQMQEIGGMNALLAERIRALTDLRLLDAVDRTVVDFSTAAERLRRQTMEVLRIAFLSSTVLELFAALGVAMTAVYVGFALLGELRFGAWTTPLTVAEGVFLLLLAPDFFQPMRELAAAWHDRAAAQAVASELADLEAAPKLEIPGGGLAGRALTGPASVEARALSWTTPAGRLIRFPEFSIAAGERIAITGRSGSGKSTLLALLAGLAPCPDGDIRVAGELLDDRTADAWRGRLGWIGQAPQFFNGSLRANLIISGQTRDDDRLANSLALASADQIVRTLPGGLDTRLGETGHGVSGGEARRLMIARALYSDADIILADEPTSDLDRDTASAVTEGLLALSARGATLIVATHDLQLARRLDRIIDLETAG
ncbi:thiol reductant ABC exporter subunit CydD [Flavimaribacter sediminis]|nr:thiol reductant ABC exporter subunit CydD [Flavimaribacter sediminis]